MPTQLQIQNTILSAGLLMANLVEKNRLLLVGGTPKGNIDWKAAQWFYLNINALQRQYNAKDYTSAATLSVYDCLQSKIGFNPGLNNIDPNYQFSGGVILLPNPSTVIPPRVLQWSDFSTDNSPDGGITRNTYYNSTWKGANPFMALTSPMLTGLKLGTDYSILPGGGFRLMLAGNLPGIFNGQLITVYSYAPQ